MSPGTGTGSSMAYQGMSFSTFICATSSPSESPDSVPTGPARTFQIDSDKYGAEEYDDLVYIIAGMMDYIRNTNLYDGLLTPNNRYNRQPKVTAKSLRFVCAAEPMTMPRHGTAPPSRPRGIGRMLTVSEVALVFSCRTIQHPNGPILPDPTDSAYGPANPAASADRIPGNLNIEVEVGALVEGFSPGHGWGEYRRRHISVDRGNRTTRRHAQGPTTPDGTRIASMSVNGKQLVYGRQNDPRQTQAIGGYLGTDKLLSMDRSPVSGSHGAGTWACVTCPT